MQKQSKPPEILKLLAHDLRWRLFQHLSEGDYRVHELVEHLHQPMNLVSYHLKKLRQDGLVAARRSEADGRDVYYSLDLEHLRRLYFEAASTLHPALAIRENTPEIKMRQARVLFICTHNSARSQMAEAWMRYLSKGQIEVYSAGSQPSQLHPDAIRTMARFEVDIRQQQSKSLSRFSGQSFDYVISVCDLARETCPTFPGTPQQLHWGFPDPTLIEDQESRALAFEHTARRLKSRVESFLTG